MGLPKPMLSMIWTRCQEPRAAQAVVVAAAIAAEDERMQVEMRTVRRTLAGWCVAFGLLGPTAAATAQAGLCAALAAVSLLALAPGVR